MSARVQRLPSMALALALDLLGEPPTRLHPVVGMGRYLAWARRRMQARTPGGQLAQGAAFWVLGAALCYGAGRPLEALPWYAQGILLKPLLARRALFGAVAQVARALEGGHLPEARRLLSYHLVSRDTSSLSAAEVAGAAIESLSENLSDSVVAPLVTYMLGGLGGAALYRYSNTADAMWGYRTAELEYRGKAAARADDLLNLLPARLCALSVLLAAGGRGAAVWLRDHAATPSPNAGHPMSAFAGVLGVRLDKRGLYTLNAAGREPSAPDIWAALGLARRSLAVACALVGALALLGAGHD